MSKRIYAVDGPEGIETRLVNATTRGVAVSHVAKDHFTARIPKAPELVKLVNKGTKVEETEETAPE